MGTLLDTVFLLQKEEVPIKMMIIGDAGGGKTTLAGSANAYWKTKKCLYVIVEDGQLALTEPEVYESDIKMSCIRIKTFEQFEALCNELITEKHDYKTLIIDTISVLAKLFLSNIIDERNARQKRNKREDRITEHYTNEQQDYNSNLNLFIDLLDDLKNTKLHLILIAHARWVKELNKWTPDIHEAVCNLLRADMDIVGYLEKCDSTITKAWKDRGGSLCKDKKLRRIYFEHDNYDVKDRTPLGKLGEVIYNPTIEAICTKLFGVQEEQTEKVK